MASVLKKNSRQTLSLWVSVSATLKRYNLQRMYDSKFILNESYIRGIRAIENGTTIKSHIAWLRQTSHNIVKELSRQRKKQRRQINTVEEISEEAEEDEERETIRQLEHKRMQAAFSQLEPIEREILSLKVVNGYRWNRIKLILADKGYGNIKEPTLRKRKARALKKLQEYYKRLDDQA